MNCSKYLICRPSGTQPLWKGWEPLLLGKLADMWEGLALMFAALKTQSDLPVRHEENRATTVANRKATCFRRGISWVQLWWKAVQGQTGASWIVCPAVPVTLDQKLQAGDGKKPNWNELRREWKISGRNQYSQLLRNPLSSWIENELGPGGGCRI